MRIQHNIMAMNAYRNYNTNTSALAKNLEKLSSGYKINRAGDDAAGLAISEKMRAQITGLNAAQKNVKDGISLVKTAEGAMQEIQDMLNRMDYLATQSANGTYDDPVDRANLQKEVEALKSEINRIADSANFNGIKLLDGSLSKTGVASVESKFTLPGVGSTLGVETILHQGTGGDNEAAEFSVELHDLAFDDNADNTLTLKIGDASFTLTGANADSNTPLDAAAIAQKFVDGDFQVNGAAVDPTAVEINGNTYTVELSSTGTGIKFIQADADLGNKADLDLDVTVSGEGENPGWTTGAYTAGTAAKADDGTDVAWNNDASATVKMKINGTTYTFKAEGLAGDAAGAAIGTALGAATATVGGETKSLSDFADVVFNADNTFTLTVKDEFKTSASVTSFAYTADTADVTDPGDVGGGGQNAAGTAPALAAAGAATGSTGGVTGDYNVKVTDKFAGNVKGDNRLASTVLTLKPDMVKDGAAITIGGKDYKFTTDKAAKDDPTKGVYIGDLDVSKADDMKKALNRLTDSAVGNTVYTVGYDGNDDFKITIVENPAYTTGNQEYDLTKLSEIERSVGYKTAATAGGDGLTLQIGDTADSYNQLKVQVGDMHTAALGIADLDISNPASASDAIQTIRDAINNVSSVRGDLGAVQNRLEHTANNLSVMAENIQDAESTIRDTDVAEEMMAYTKNNILIQSAQAMLAQANAVPQGVLQLLG